MSHHGDNPFPDSEMSKKLFEKFTDRNKLMRDLLVTTGFKGALGEFPKGKLNKDDEGAIQFAIGAEGDKVILDFGTSVHWVGMTPQEAADLGSLLLKRAREVARKKGESVAFNIMA